MANRNRKFDALPTELLSGGGVTAPHPTVGTSLSIQYNRTIEDRPSRSKLLFYYIMDNNCKLSKILYSTVGGE